MKLEEFVERNIDDIERAEWGVVLEDWYNLVEWGNITWALEDTLLSELLTIFYDVLGAEPKDVKDCAKEVLEDKISDIIYEKVSQTNDRFISYDDIYSDVMSNLGFDADEVRSLIYTAADQCGYDLRQNGFYTEAQDD